MSRLTISRAINIGHAGHGGEVSLKIPELALDIPSPEEVATRAAARVRDFLKGMLGSQRDAEGASHTVAPATIRARKYAMHPPKQQNGKWKLQSRETRFSSRGETRSITEKWRARGQGTMVRKVKLGGDGRVKSVETTRRVTTGWWERRYGPGGPSKGGSQAFYDSGRLVDAMQVRSASGGATVVAPDRGAAVAVMEAKGVPIMTISPRVIEQALEAELDLMLVPWRR